MNPRALFYCSASETIDPYYNQVARECVIESVKAGYSIVSGGTTKGTMDVVCKAAHEAGAKENICVIPRFMEGLSNPMCTSVIWTDTMSERKEIMREGASLIVALPGGIGTLDEFAESFTLLKLRRIDAKLVVMNINGFYDPLIALLEHYVRTEMLPEENLKELYFPTSVEEFKKILSE